MIVGGSEDMSGFWSDLGKGLKQVGIDTATGAARSAAGSAGRALNKASETNKPPPVAVKQGVPTGVWIAGSVVLGIGLLALVTRRPSPAPRPAATNPRRRRRRRRRSR